MTIVRLVHEEQSLALPVECPPRIHAFVLDLERHYSRCVYLWDKDLCLACNLGLATSFVGSEAQVILRIAQIEMTRDD